MGICPSHSYDGNTLLLEYRYQRDRYRPLGGASLRFFRVRRSPYPYAVLTFSLTHHASILPNFIGELEEVDGMAILATELVKHKEELIALPEVGGQTTNNAELLDHILDEIVEAAASRSLIHLDVVSSLLSVCITENRTSPYGKLLDALISNKLPFYCSYGKCFAEIIQILTELLREHSISVSSSPTHLFFYHIIETYLQEILGSKEGSPYLKISMLACGHEACEQVNDFMRSEETRMRSDQYEAIRKCVEYWRIGGRHNLLKIDHILKSADKELVKEHEALAAQHWDIRLADARKFLTSIGTDEEISKIMGERYLDVEKALEGSQAFVASNEDTMVGIE